MTEQVASPVVEPTSQPVDYEARAKLYAALAKAQAAFKEVKKTKKANYGMYADLAAILDAVRPALNANGCFLYQDVRSLKGHVGVRTIIVHESGQTLESSELFMPADAGGKNAAQAFGSARTYACRYSLASFLGIAADDDDDGQSAAAAPQAAPRKGPPAPRSFPPSPSTRPIPNELEDIPY